MAKRNRNLKMTPAFLRLLLAKLESPTISTAQFIKLSNLYATSAGLIEKAKEQAKKQSKIKTEKAAKLVPATMLSEIEQIQQIEDAQRKSNG